MTDWEPQDEFEEYFHEAVNFLIAVKDPGIIAIEHSLAVAEDSDPTVYQSSQSDESQPHSQLRSELDPLDDDQPESDKGCQATDQPPSQSPPPQSEELP